MIIKCPIPELCKTVRSHLQHWDLVYKILEKWACQSLQDVLLFSSAPEAEVMTWDRPGQLKTRGVVARSASLACTRPWHAPHAGEDTLQSKNWKPHC